MKHQIAGTLIIGGVVLACTRLGLFGKNKIKIPKDFKVSRSDIKNYGIVECCIIEEDGELKRSFKYWSMRPMQIDNLPY